MGPIVLKPILLGGWHASTENTNKVERYDIQKNIWSFVSPMIERRYRPGVAVLGGKIYVLGLYIAIECTLVYLINVLHILFFFENFLPD